MRQFIIKRHLPVISDHGWSTLAPVLQYGALFPDLIPRSAGYVTRILNGAKPGDLPIQLPTKFQMVVNLKSAKEIGLTVPQSIILQADRLIE